MLENEFNKAEELVAQLKAYIRTEVELAKLTIAEKLSKVLADFIAVLVAGLFFLFFILFGSLAMAYLLGQWTGSIWAGFLIVAVLYLLVGMIAWYAREKLIRNPLLNAIIRTLFNKEEPGKHSK